MADSQTTPVDLFLALFDAAQGRNPGLSEIVRQTAILIAALSDRLDGIDNIISDSLLEPDMDALRANDLSPEVVQAVEDACFYDPYCLFGSALIGLLDAAEIARCDHEGGLMVRLYPDIFVYLPFTSPGCDEGGYVDLTDVQFLPKERVKACFDDLQQAQRAVLGESAPQVVVELGGGVLRAARANSKDVSVEVLDWDKTTAENPESSAYLAAHESILRAGADGTLGINSDLFPFEVL